MEVFWDCLKREARTLLRPESPWEEVVRSFCCSACFITIGFQFVEEVVGSLKLPIPSY
jgi:hypothetical protein